MCVETLKTLIEREGLTKTVEYLTSGNLPKEVKEELEKKKIFCGGYPVLSVLYSLEAAIASM